MSKLRTFFCAYYFDGTAEDFILHAIYSDRAAAEQSFEDLPDSLQHRNVIELTLEGLKKQILDAAVEQGRTLRGLDGVLAGYAPKGDV